MRTNTPDRNAVFQSCRGAASITGLSVKYIRAGCADGTIPHIRIGSDYRINMPLFLSQLNNASAGKIEGGVNDGKIDQTTEAN